MTEHYLHNAEIFFNEVSKLFTVPLGSSEITVGWLVFFVVLIYFALKMVNPDE